MRTPLFARLSAATAMALARGDIAPLAASIADAKASDSLLFVTRVHGVSAFVATLSDAAPAALPPAVHAELDAERSRIAARHRGLEADLARIAAAAAVRDLPFVPLKGSVGAIQGLASARLRPTADINLLAEDRDAGRWAALLIDLGYVRGARSLKHETFVRPAAREIQDYAEHPANPRPVELHVRLYEHVLGRTLDVTSRYRANLRPHQFGDGLALVPGPTGLALHRWLHASLSLGHRGVRLVQLLDLRDVSPNPVVGRELVQTLDELAWALWTITERTLPGLLPEAWASMFAAAAPPVRRQRAWLARPGVLGSAESDAAAVAGQLRLCRSTAEAARFLVSLVPERALLETHYGPATPIKRVGQVGRYIADRFAPRSARGNRAPSSIKRS